jgi:hypothetical protein
MRVSLGALLAGWVAVVVFVIACQQDAGSSPGDAPDGATEAPEGTSTASASATPTVTDTRFGVAGITPAGFPDSTADQWNGFYDSIEGYGGLLGLYVDWRDEPLTEEGVPKILDDQVQLAADRGFTGLPLIGAHQQLNGPATSTIDWHDPSQVAAFADVVVRFAGEHQPEFLGIGNEINMVWESEPEQFDGFAAALPGIVAAVRAASPETQVFTVFALEALTGDAFLMGNSEARQPQWELLDRVSGTVDVIAFTTYPYFDFETPLDIPDDYYAAAAERAGKPIAFTEVGWPSAPLAVAPDSGYGGTLEEQAAFATRFLELTRPLEPRFALWLFAFDPGGVGDPFASVALGTHEGEPKPAYHLWAAEAAR